MMGKKLVKSLITIAVIINIIVQVVTDTTLRAVRNYDARLPCGQGKIFLDGPDAYILWLKDDEKFLYRFPNEDTLAKTSNPNNIYGTSCLDDSHCYDDTSLFLSKVGDEDAGKYRCRVHYQGSSSVDYVIDLRIVDPTGTPKIFNEEGEQIVTPFIGPLTLGSNLTMTCEVTISDPPTTVAWLRNGAVARRVVSDRAGLLRERVDIVHASRDDLDAHYQCTATNADVTEPMTASVIVKMYLPPLKVQIRLNNNYDFEVGQPRVVDCVVVGCVPTPTINWYIGGKLVKANAHKELHDGNYTVSSLTLTASMRDDDKRLSCRVHNAYLPTVFEDNVTLHVGFRPTCATADDVVAVTLSEPKTLQARVMSSDEPTQCRWTFADGRNVYTAPILVPGTEREYTTTLTWVPTKDDLGILTCQALNGFGQQKEPCSYSVVEGARPEAPRCKVGTRRKSWEIDENMHEILCGGRRNGQPQIFHLNVLDAQGRVIHNDSNGHGNFSLLPLEGTNLTARMHSSNSWGNSSVTILRLNNSKSEGEEKRDSFFTSRNTGLVGGVVLLASGLGAVANHVARRKSGDLGGVWADPSANRWDFLRYQSQLQPELPTGREPRDPELVYRTRPYPEPAPPRDVPAGRPPDECSFLNSG